MFYSGSAKNFILCFYELMNFYTFELLFCEFSNMYKNNLQVTQF